MWYASFYLRNEVSKHSSFWVDFIACIRTLYYITYSRMRIMNNRYSDYRMNWYKII